MKHKKNGFTLVEMSLFLAVTGLLFVGIIAGTQNTIRRQRYNDSVQNFVDFWRNIYASVSNTQNNTAERGRSDQAIYGKLVVFGQTKGLDSKPVNNKDQVIYSYDVVADATSAGTGSAVEVLKEMHANILVMQNDIAYTAGIAESYIPTWGAVIESTRQDLSGGAALFKGSILVIRHPRSGVINTFISKNTVIDANQYLTGASVSDTDVNKLLQQYLNRTPSENGAFVQDTIDFCVNSDDIGFTKTRRQDVRLIQNARNQSGIEIISLDDSDNPCTH